MFRIRLDQSQNQSKSNGNGTLFQLSASGLAALTGVLTVAFAVMAFRARHPLERAGFALVVGGALGNIIDRVRQGAVTDFLDFYWRDWHWPTFNVADIAITLGAVLILAASFPLCRRKEPVLDQH